MSYEKTTWETNDVITAEKLNHMEDGIAEGGGGSGVLAVTVDTTDMALNKTWQEIRDASEVGIVVLNLVTEEQTNAVYLKETNISGDEYQVGWSDESYYIASSASGYPVFSDQ